MLMMVTMITTCKRKVIRKLGSFLSPFVPFHDHPVNAIFCDFNAATDFFIRRSIELYNNKSERHLVQEIFKHKQSKLILARNE